MDPSLESVLEVLHDLAPPGLAAEWDNVGLLLEGTRTIQTVILCIDLTEAVFDEARERSADLIVAYHPPIFKGIRRLTGGTPQGRVLLGALRGGISVYSPHTALDAATGGMCDWLLESFGVPFTDSAPIQPDRSDPSVGAGRRAVLATPRPLTDAVASIKEHPHLAHVRVASPTDRSIRAPISTVAVCPGAGGSVLSSLGSVDLILTGEMRHHDVLSWAAQGTTVVLTDHTHTERGYLLRLADRIRRARPRLSVGCAATDVDPLVVW